MKRHQLAPAGSNWDPNAWRVCNNQWLWLGSPTVSYDHGEPRCPYFAGLVEQVGHQTHHQSEVSFTSGWKYLGTVKMWADLWPRDRTESSFANVRPKMMASRQDAGEHVDSWQCHLKSKSVEFSNVNFKVGGMPSLMKKCQKKSNSISIIPSTEASSAKFIGGQDKHLHIGWCQVLPLPQ